MILNAHRNDPLSSILAGEAIEDTGTAAYHRQVIYALVKRFPGLTSAEMTQWCALDRYQIARRLPEIVGVEKGDMRECTVCKRLCVTWYEKR